MIQCAQLISPGPSEVQSATFSHGYQNLSSPPAASETLSLYKDHIR
jgi:hypothetical protein